MTAKSPRACSARLTGVTVASVDMEAILGNNRKTGPYAGPAPGNTQASRHEAGPTTSAGAERPTPNPATARKTCGAGFTPAHGGGAQPQPEPTSAGRHKAGPTKSRAPARQAAEPTKPLGHSSPSASATNFPALPPVVFLGFRIHGRFDAGSRASPTTGPRHHAAHPARALPPGARHQRGAVRAAGHRGLRHPGHARRQPAEMAPGAHHLVL